MASSHIAAVFALFHYLHECFITTCTRSQSAANQHDPLSLSTLLSLESIYCTSGNAAELDEVTVHPGAHGTNLRKGQHIPILSAHIWAGGGWKMQCSKFHYAVYL